MKKVKRNTVKIIKASDAKNCSVWTLPNFLDNDNKNSVHNKNKSKHNNNLKNNNNDNVSLKDSAFASHIRDSKPNQSFLNKSYENSNKENYEKSYKESYEESYEEGYQKGLLAGKNEGSLEFKENNAKLTNLYNKFIKAFDEVNNHITTSVQKLAVVIAKALIKVEISLSPKVITNCLKEALNLLPANSKDITILVSEHDQNILKQLPKRKLLTKFKNLNIEVDKKIESGGFKVVTPKTTIDSTVEKRLTQILKNINDVKQNNT